MMNLSIDPDALKPLIAEVVREVLSQHQADQARLGGKLAYSEQEAAALLGLNPWQIRDSRLRGEIEHGRGPGRRVLYSQAQLLAYLDRRKGEPAQSAPPPARPQRRVRR